MEETHETAVVGIHKPGYVVKDSQQLPAAGQGSQIVLPSATPGFELLTLKWKEELS